MKKNAGFTLVEIIVSFTLTMVIILFLFQIIITLKQIYNNNFITSDLVLKQANISQMINKDLMSSNLGSVESISGPDSNNCYTIFFESGNRRICYNRTNNTIAYSDYEFKLVDNSKIGTDASITVESIGDISNRILKINIPITYPDIDKDFGIKVAYFN